MANRSFHYAAGNATFNFCYFRISPSSCVFSESFAPSVVIKSCNRSSALQVPVLTIWVFQARITIDVPLLMQGNVPLFCADAEAKAPNLWAKSKSKPQRECDWTRFMNFGSISHKNCSAGFHFHLSIPANCPAFWGIVALFYTLCLPLKKFSNLAGLWSRALIRFT